MPSPGFRASPGFTRNDIATLMTSYPSWVHPDVAYAETEWNLLRDAFEGERALKRYPDLYLPKPSGMDDDQYDFYVENATYYNMTARTVGALVGTLFKRNPVINGLPKRLERGLKNITKDRESLRSFAMRTAREVVHMGRFGILVERAATGRGSPYLVGYVTESILDWTVEQDDEGRNRLTEVVLMEVDEVDRVAEAPRKFIPSYRVLRLVNGQYEQHVYKTNDKGAIPDIYSEATEVIIPLNRGNPLDFIPFMFFGAESNLPKYERSPVIDIARLNLSHYRSYAHLEHGRYYTGLPVFYVSKANNSNSDAEYTIGPSTVWEVAQGEKAGLLEFNGHGLKFLENALSKKEAQAASLGGRLIGVESQSVSESDNQVQMKNRNEQALLLNVSLVLDEGYSRILQWWAIWQDTRAADVETLSIEFTKEFLLKEVSAREFRAIQAMYKDGLIPIEVVHDYLQRAEVIPDWITLPEFKKLIDSMNSFPNNPDVEAKKEGFPDRKTQIQVEENELNRQAEDSLQESDQQHTLRLARQNAAAARQNAGQSNPSGDNNS